MRLNGSHIGLVIAAATAVLVASCSSAVPNDSVHFAGPSVVVKCYGANTRRGFVPLTEQACVERRIRT